MGKSDILFNGAAFMIQLSEIGSVKMDKIKEGKSTLKVMNTLGFGL
jgi:hypothetical protein